jgi:hypothetical protein
MAAASKTRANLPRQMKIPSKEDKGLKKPMLRCLFYQIVFGLSIADSQVDGLIRIGSAEYLSKALVIETPNRV